MNSALYKNQWNTNKTKALFLIASAIQTNALTPERPVPRMNTLPMSIISYHCQSYLYLAREAVKYRDSTGSAGLASLQSQRLAVILIFLKDCLIANSRATYTNFPIFSSTHWDNEWVVINSVVYHSHHSDNNAGVCG